MSGSVDEAGAPVKHRASATESTASNIVHRKSIMAESFSFGDQILELRRPRKHFDRFKVELLATLKHHENDDFPARVPLSKVVLLDDIFEQRPDNAAWEKQEIVQVNGRGESADKAEINLTVEWYPDPFLWISVCGLWTTTIFLNTLAEPQRR